MLRCVKLCGLLTELWGGSGARFTDRRTSLNVVRCPERMNVTRLLLFIGLRRSWTWAWTSSWSLIDTVGPASRVELISCQGGPRRLVCGRSVGTVWLSACRRRRYWRDETPTWTARDVTRRTLVSTIFAAAAGRPLNTIQ